MISDQALHGTYRCPVCGHRDSVDVRAGGPARTVICSNCETVLEVSTHNPTAVHFTTRIAEAHAQG